MQNGLELEETRTPLWGNKDLLTWAGRRHAPAALPSLCPRSTPLFSGKAGAHLLLRCMSGSEPLSVFSPVQPFLAAWGTLNTNQSWGEGVNGGWGKGEISF